MLRAMKDKETSEAKMNKVHQQLDEIKRNIQALKKKEGKDQKNLVFLTAAQLIHWGRGFCSRVNAPQEKWKPLKRASLGRWTFKKKKKKSRKNVEGEERMEDQEEDVGEEGQEEELKDGEDEEGGEEKESPKIIIYSLTIPKPSKVHRPTCVHPAPGSFAEIMGHLEDHRCRSLAVEIALKEDSATAIAPYTSSWRRRSRNHVNGH